MRCAFRRQIFRQSLPLAAGHEHIEDSVEVFALVDRPPPSAAPGRRNERSDQHSLGVAQVTRITKAAAAIGKAMFGHENATPLQRAVDRITALLGRPRFIGVLTVIAASWISLNLLAAALGYRPIDPPPFSWLGGAVSLVSLYMVILILATQQREYQLAQLREQLTLELAILSEQKTAKVIQLLEESRRDNPLIRDRVDQEAEAMAQPADPQSVLVRPPITTRDDDSALCALRVLINTFADGRGSVILAC
jgi:uncharacterized membrane protein